MRFVAAAVALGLVLSGCSDEGDRDAFCAQLPEVPEFLAVLDTVDPADPAAANEAFADAIALLDELEDTAPSAVRDDVGTIADVARLLAEALADVNPGAALDNIPNLAAELEELDAASAEVVAYARDECGIDLSAERAGS